MHPAVVVDWGPLQFAVSAYRLALIGAAAMAVLGTTLVAVSRGAPRSRTVFTVLVAAMGAVAGARLVGAMSTGSAVLASSFGSFSIWGAIAGGLLVGLVAWRPWRRTGVPAAVLLDAAAVPAGVAIGIARTGCMCAGCCFGLPTHLPWGVTYPSGSNAHIANLDSSNLLDSLFSSAPPVHPVPIYDGAAALLASGAALLTYRRFVRTGRARTGASGAIFLVTYATARFIIEHFRYHPQDVGLLSPGAWQLLFAMVAVAASLWLWRSFQSSVTLTAGLPRR